MIEVHPIAYTVGPESWPRPHIVARMTDGRWRAYDHTWRPEPGFELGRRPHPDATGKEGDPPDIIPTFDTAETAAAFAAGYRCPVLCQMCIANRVAEKGEAYRDAAWALWPLGMAKLQREGKLR